MMVDKVPQRGAPGCKLRPTSWHPFLTTSLSPEQVCLPAQSCLTALGSLSDTLPLPSVSHRWMTHLGVFPSAPQPPPPADANCILNKGRHSPLGTCSARLYSWVVVHHLGAGVPCPTLPAQRSLQQSPILYTAAAEPAPVHGREGPNPEDKGKSQTQYQMETKALPGKTGPTVTAPLCSACSIPAADEEGPTSGHHACGPAPSASQARGPSLLSSLL